MSEQEAPFWQTVLLQDKALAFLREQRQCLRDERNHSGAWAADCEESKAFIKEHRESSRDAPQKFWLVPHSQALLCSRDQHVIQLFIRCQIYLRTRCSRVLQVANPTTLGDNLRAHEDHIVTFSFAHTHTCDIWTHSSTKAKNKQTNNTFPPPPIKKPIKITYSKTISNPVKKVQKRKKPSI